MRKFGLYVPSRQGESEYNEVEERRKWCRSLNETTLRSLAADYKQGIRTPDCLDAWEEYCRRFPGELEERAAKQEAAQAKRKKRR